MIKRYESCIGLSLPAIGRYKIEFWYAPPGYEIKEHTHNNEDIKLILLFGHYVRFHRRCKGSFLGESFLATIGDFGRVFNIRSGDAHWFSVSNWPLIFMNIERWLIPPTSAADDFQLT